MGKDMASEQMDDMLTVREVARLLHIHPNTLRRWSNKGRIRAYRISPRGDRRFKREEIARFLAEFNAYAGDWREA
jgi:excisionase family DNA binding protein